MDKIVTEARDNWYISFIIIMFVMEEANSWVCGGRYRKLWWKDET
jgi:hypothetical protein